MNHERGKILDRVLSLLRSKSNYRFTVDQIASSLDISVYRTYQLLIQLAQKNKIQLMSAVPAGSSNPGNLSYQINEEGFFFIKKGGFSRAFKRSKLRRLLP